MAWWISLEYVLGYMLDLFDTADRTLKYWFLYQQEGYFRETYIIIFYIKQLLTIPIQAFHTL